MKKLKDLRAGDSLLGLDASGAAEIVSVTLHGTGSVSVIFRTAAGGLGERMLFVDDEALLETPQSEVPWSFTADGEHFKLAAEAFRIRLAHLFDPMMAVHTSNVEPLPHQISAVYEAMLPRQPLRFVLADDPGAGKTIMAGLLIRELIMRADTRRVLIVSPGSLSGQWQDELREKFGLQFELFGREMLDASASGNPFNEKHYLIARLDQLSRDEELQEKLKASFWDLIVVDEAHKLSANYFGQKVNKTKRFLLGELLGSVCRHYLLMTATPHNGKPEDFQLFLSLLDADRFYGKAREGNTNPDVSDLMRRMVKEDLLKFDGTRLFPERRAYTANYSLTDAEATLYGNVTDYVRNEMNRADKLDGKRKGTVGFALTQLQRRLASSPAAIYQSLHRRRKRMEDRLAEEKLLARADILRDPGGGYQSTNLDLPDDLDEAEDALAPEDYEDYTEQIVDEATAAKTLVELEAEIFSLKALEAAGLALLKSGHDRKWEQLSRILQDAPEMTTAEGLRRKLIIFTEHRDTLNYLQGRIGNLLGSPEAVVTIHGGCNRDERRKTQEEFRQNKQVIILIATDAAGEGVNLQNASLMVNYDLPWNPNRIEQRFGRIHRIGQREVCHLWNLVANETREGAVFQKLFDKLEVVRAALGGRVFDVLGEAFQDVSLKDLLVRAIRYGEQPETKAKLYEVIDNSLDTKSLLAIFERNALVDNTLSIASLYAIKEEMDKAEARKLQPHFIRSFFLKAFAKAGGEARAREHHRYELPHVPASLREHDRVINDTRTPVLRQYHRVCFERHDVRVDGKPVADLLHPAHPLVAAVLDATLESYRNSLKQGSALLDAANPGIEPSLLVLLDHSVREGSTEDAKTISRRLQFVSVAANGQVNFAGWAPHLDLQTLPEDGTHHLAGVLAQPWLKGNVETLALRYATEHIVPEHYIEVRDRRVRQADKIEGAVQARLVREINQLTHRALELDVEVAAGRQPRVQPENLKRRAEDLAARLTTRKRELAIMRQVTAALPQVVGAALVIPQGLYDHWQGEPASHTFSVDAAARQRIELIAMQAVRKAEEALGHSVKDVSAEKCGWDITSRPPLRNGVLVDDRLIEVKGRVKGANTITVTRNEIITALNKPEQFILAVVFIDGDTSDGPYYVRQPFSQEPEWGMSSMNMDLPQLLTKAEKVS